jgi:hypothetical protein
LGVTIHRAESATVNARGMGHDLTTTSTVVPSGMLMALPTFAPLEVFRRTTVAVDFVERSTQMRL